MPYQFPNGAYRVGGGVSVPRLLTRTQPDCTPEARAAGIDGSIEVLVTVGEDGIARDLRIQNGLGYGLDEKARNA
jgi:periplasmic protein TonB